MPDLIYAQQILDPLRYPSEWQRVDIGGIFSPGVIDINGITGFKRSTGWDLKQGKGTAGATLTKTTSSPAKGSFRFVLWLPDHFNEWTLFREILVQPVPCISISYPALADLGIYAVVVEDVGLLTYAGKGRYTATIDLIEWTPPPQKASVATPPAPAPDQNPAPQPLSPDEIQIAEKEAVLKNVMRQSQNPGLR